MIFPALIFLWGSEALFLHALLIILPLRMGWESLLQARQLQARNSDCKLCSKRTRWSSVLRPLSTDGRTFNLCKVSNFCLSGVSSGLPLSSWNFSHLGSAILLALAPGHLSVLAGVCRKTPTIVSVSVPFLTATLCPHIRLQNLSLVRERFLILVLIFFLHCFVHNVSKIIC